MRKLALADPETAGEFRARLEREKIEPDSAVTGAMADDIIYGLSLTTSLGRAIAGGYVRLIAAGVGPGRIDRYRRAIRREGDENTTCAEIIAGSFGSVLIWGDDGLADEFLRILDLLKRKWLYALSAEPMEVVSEIIGPRGTSAGSAWLKFLADVFAHDLTYNQFRRFSAVFPRAVRSWPAGKRTWRIEQLRRVVRHDFNLACVFADALNRELSLLAEKGLEQFVSEGLARYQKDESRGLKFLGLDTRSALEACHRLRETGVLSLNRQRLSTYLQARCGRPVPIQPVSAMTGPVRETDNGEALAFFDGRTIFLADEIGRFPDHHRNDFLYKALAWIEAGLLEFNTFDFDLERFADLYAETAGLQCPDEGDAGDLDRFFKAFPDPRIAGDLFSVFEYGRIRTLLENAYPAGAQRYFPLAREEARTMLRSVDLPALMPILFAGIALNDDMQPWLGAGERNRIAANNIFRIFTAFTAGAAYPEASAAGVRQVLTGPCRDIFPTGGNYVPLSTPFGLRVRPDLFYAAFASYERQAGMIKEKIARLSGQSVPRSMIRRRLQEQGGRLSPEDLREMIHDVRRGTTSQDTAAARVTISPADLDMEALYRELNTEAPGTDDFGSCIFRYPEWDHHIGDYLASHVMVRQRTVTAEQTDFYRDTLSRYAGLVKKIRYAFEMLKPEGITVLRKWREGEEFDYRQLLEYAVDKKAGRTPSERIYIKRLKSQRDVAVLLLLDFSRSTSNKVAGSDTAMVLDVEKEALVLFCEALSVTGDSFAIAGFSGTGRLGVDYFQIKSFDEPINDDVRRRIGMISPQRNTRMGAAIRHATARFTDMTARTRLLIIISDGFPNDIDYKRDYALADTRRSLLEARTKGIIVHSITINIAGDSKLDDLYGRVRHSVISDVRELPDRLVRIYGRLTG
ncbi:MAG: VWA domain-containing protein [Thermodesulfobacteriota bacterium]